MKQKKRILPVTTKAQREQMADDWVKLREKIGDRMREAHEAHMYAYGALLNLELLFGQPPTPPETVQPEKLPAPAWRSMASAPRDGGRFLGIVAPFLVVCIGYICADGEHFRAQDGRLYLVEEMIAWAPIPEWTGEVAE